MENRLHFSLTKFVNRKKLTRNKANHFQHARRFQKSIFFHAILFSVFHRLVYLFEENESFYTLIFHILTSNLKVSVQG